MSIPALATAQMAEVDRLMIEDYGTRSVLIHLHNRSHHPYQLKVFSYD